MQKHSVLNFEHGVEQGGQVLLMSAGYGMKDEILSVGIDIGTTTTSMIVSMLGVSNTASANMVPDVNITAKRIIYRSGLYFTPLKDRTLLDGDAIHAIIEQEYAAAGIRPEDVDTGAVIITGESSLKENAKIVVDSLSMFAGDFVVATAGPDLESILAGRGSGAEAFSKKYGCIAANLDIGGGTTNIAVFDCGSLVGQTCIDVGGRIMKYDASGRITYVSKRLNDLGGVRNLHFGEGDTVSDSALGAIGELLADTVLDAVHQKHTDLTAISTTSSSNPVVLKEPIQFISFSGGVADCFYGNEQDMRRFNDLGPCIAAALRRKCENESFQVVTPAETIRATVVGAGTYMTEVSGSTISYTENLFPIKNLPVFVPSEKAEDTLYENNASMLIDELKWYMRQSGAEHLGICVHGKARLAYIDVLNMAEALLDADSAVFSPDETFIIVCENDMAKALGQVMGRIAALKPVRPNNIVCLDKIRIRSGDYIDIGRPVMDGVALPVVVKTLIFN